MRLVAVPVVCVVFAAACPAIGQEPAHGPVYEIVEPDMLAEIQRQLRAKERSGELGRLLEEGRRRAENSIRNPAPVAGLSAAVQRRVWSFDPTLVVHEDIVAPDGAVIARRGDRVNPLEHVPFAGTWFFFDARDEAQVREARRVVAASPSLVKPILVGGSWEAARKQLGQRVYFDQAGLLVRRFGIAATPAIMRRQGDVLLLEEYPIR